MVDGNASKPRTVATGITTRVMPLQPANALVPMLVTPLPIHRLTRPLQLANALAPILVTLSGIVTLVRPLQ